MAKSSTPNGPVKSKRPARKKASSKNPLIMVAALASSMIAAVVVGLLVINSNSFKSFRASLSGTDSETKKKSASNEPVEFDPNYDYSKDKRGLGNGEAGKKNQPNTNEDKNKSKPAKPTWNELAADRDIPPALMEPQTDLDIVCQPVKLAISQRNYDQATELFEAASKDPERSPTLAFSDLESRLKTLDKFWRSVRRGLAQCIPGTEIKRCGEWLECVSKGPDFITFRQSSGAEKAFKTDFLDMDTDLAVALQRSVDTKDQDSGNLFAELDFVGNRNLMAVTTELQKAGPKKQTAKKSRDKPKATEPKPAVTSTERENSAQRLPVPDKQQQAAKSKLVRELFDEQYADRTDQGRAALTKLLIKQGNETNDDDAGRFVLYQEALELAEKTGDAQSAWTAVNAIVENYEVNAFDAKNAVLRELGKKSNDSALFSTLVGDCQDLIQLDIQLDQYSVAAEKARKLLATAKKGATKSTIENVSALISKIRTLNNRFAKIEEQLAILQNQPDDPQANQSVGEFYFCSKGDFDKGLLFLALGEGETAELAKQELNSPGDPKSKTALGDLWWEFADSRKQEEKENVRTHAVDLYREALPHLTGINRKRVESRIATSQIATSQSRGSEALISQNRWNITWENNSTALVMFSENGSFIAESLKSGKTYPGEWRYETLNDFEGILVELEASTQFYFIQEGALEIRQLNSKGKVVMSGTGSVLR